MKQQILSNLNDPGQLEKLYRDNKSHFKNEFNILFPQIRDNSMAQFWKERLNFETDEINWGNKRELNFVLIASLIAAFIAKLPFLFNWEQDYFFQRNISFVIFPVLVAYFAWQQKLQLQKVIPVAATMLVLLIYINLLPFVSSSDSLFLSCIHLPFFCWALLGFAFTRMQLKNYPKRLDFLRYNGDLLVMSAIILISGGLVTAVTVGLFELIGLNIEQFYFENIVVCGLAAVPVFATYLVRMNPQLVSKVSPVIARVFTPVVFIMLTVYLGAVLYTGKDPYNDREFLLIFNLLLIGVMALIFFSVAEISKSKPDKLQILILLLLGIVTLIVNSIALSAILFRISEWGITPNRMAVMGSNILMLVNLGLILFRLFKVVKKSSDVEEVQVSIAKYLPVYALWTAIVVFLFPVLFGFN